MNHFFFSFLIIEVLMITVGCMESHPDLPIAKMEVVPEKSERKKERTRFEGIYRILYIGNSLDSFVIKDFSNFETYKTEYDNRAKLEWMPATGTMKKRKRKSKAVDIFIDTTQMITYVDSYTGDTSFLVRHFEGYPVFLRNVSPDTLPLWSSKFLALFAQYYDVEAQRWRPLQEKDEVFICGTGDYPIGLPPSFYCVAFFPKYETGDLKVLARLSSCTYDKEPFYYSNQIWISIGEEYLYKE